MVVLEKNTVITGLSRSRSILVVMIGYQIKDLNDHAIKYFGNKKSFARNMTITCFNWGSRLN